RRNRWRGRGSADRDVDPLRRSSRRRRRDGRALPGGARRAPRARRPVTTEAANRVQLAAGHWKPRFVANGIDANDFDRVLAATAEWREWAPNWKRVGDEHRAIADEADRSGHLVTAADAYPRAARCY